MLSIDYCKKILSKNGKNPKDDEIIKLRQLLYQLAEMDYKLFKDCKNDERTNLYKGIN